MLTLPLDEVLDLALASPPVQDLLHLVLLLADCSVVAHSRPTFLSETNWFFKFIRIFVRIH